MILKLYNKKQSFTTKINKREACGFSIVSKSSLSDIREKNTCYRGEDCMKKYCKKLREWVMKTVNYEKKDIMPLTNGQKEYHEKQNKCFICGKRFCYDKRSKYYQIIK